MAFTTGETVSDIESLFINKLSVTHVFGYLPPHGKSLAAAASKTYAGDIRLKMNTRQRAALQKDLDSGKAELLVYNRFLVSVVAATSPAIAVGDAVIYVTSTDLVSPAASTTWNTDLATTQADFTNIFLGIAATAKGAGVASQKVLVDISPFSVREFTCTSETHNLDELLSMKKDTGNALLSSTLVKAVAASSPFRVRRVDGSAATKVLASWHSAFWGNNAQGAQ